MEAPFSSLALLAIKLKARSRCIGPKQNPGEEVEEQAAERMEVIAAEVGVSVLLAWRCGWWSELQAARMR
jgi:hypothetical protein